MLSNVFIRCERQQSKSYTKIERVPSDAVEIEIAAIPNPSESEAAVFETESITSSARN